MRLFKWNIQKLFSKMCILLKTDYFVLKNIKLSRTYLKKNLNIFFLLNYIGIFLKKTPKDLVENTNILQFFARISFWILLLLRH